MEAVAQKSHEDMRLDPVFPLVEHGPDLEIAFEIPEGRFDFDQLQIHLPQLGRRFGGEIGTEQIATFSPAPLPQFGTAELVSERLRVDLLAWLGLLHLNQPLSPPGGGLGRPQLLEQIVAVKILHFAQLP